MAMQTLQDILKALGNSEDLKEEYNKSKDGPSGAWSGPPLPLNLEYRVEVDTAEIKPSKAGNKQIVLTFIITQPEEFGGRKLQSYYPLDIANEISARKLASLFGSFGVDLTNFKSNDEEFCAQFVGQTAVVALDTWGDDNDRYGIRWLNGDRGQTLKSDVKPKKAKTNSSSLRPDISIPRPDAATSGPASAPASPVVPNGLPSSARPGGVQLPPGLGGARQPDPIYGDEEPF